MCCVGTEWNARLWTGLELARTGFQCVSVRRGRAGVYGGEGEGNGEGNRGDELGGAGSSG